MIYKKFLLLFFGIFLISLVSAQVDTYKQNTEVDLKITCINNGYCSSSAICNASVFDPDNIIILDGVQATQSSSLASFNITLNSTQTSKLGQYQVTGFCKDGSVAKDIGFNFDVTYTGKVLTPQITGIYFLSTFIIIFLGILLILLINKLPSKDATDEDGTILEISNLKHLRPVLWGFVWGLVLALLFVISNITIAFLPSLMFGNLFFAFYQIMFWMTIIAIPIWFIWIFTGIFKDREYKRMVERGVEIKSTP